jgi:hypothetical protein
MPRLVEPSSIQEHDVKTFVAVYYGSAASLNAWKAMPDAERKQKEQTGIAAWMKWVNDNKGAIAGDGEPLGKTKRVDKTGVSDMRNELTAFTVVQAASHEEAANMFKNHPHFTVFPGDHIEIMECLPIPQPQ